MVLIQTPSSSFASAPIANELCMETRNISFMAPLNLDSAKTNEYQEIVLIAREKRLLFNNSNNEIEKWNGVNYFCQVLDHVVEIEKESSMFDGKRVLEIGFATGLPSVYALEHGAKAVTIAHSCEESLKAHIEPTIIQNNVNERVKYIISDLDNLASKIGSEKFDIILAPELVYSKNKHFEEIHDMLHGILAPHGIILISGRTHYHNCDGNMSSMLDLIKRKNSFDVIDRTSLSQRHVTAPRKVIQLMHKML